MAGRRASGFFRIAAFVHPEGPVEFVFLAAEGHELPEPARPCFRNRRGLKRGSRPAPDTSNLAARPLRSIPGGPSHCNGPTDPGRAPPWPGPSASRKNSNTAAPPSLRSAVSRAARASILFQRSAARRGSPAGSVRSVISSIGAGVLGFSSSSPASWRAFTS